MDVRLLGPVEASVDGRLVAVGAGKPRALLAMLALHAGATVSSNRLIDALWGERPPATAAKLVQLHVSQLRKAMAAAGDGEHIVTRGHGYELRLGPDELDVARFDRLVASGRPREALALWRGPALDDIAGEPFAAIEIRRLEERRLVAVELAIERDLEEGRHRDVLDELEGMVHAEPLREALHALRMLALYRSGRQADALGAYRQARAALVEGIGVEPGPELRRLQEAILRQDPALELPAPEPLELPPELDISTPLVGRRAELDRLVAHWRLARAGEGRLVVLVGAQGMGKTRLAAELAAQVRGDGGAVRYVAGAAAAAGALVGAPPERQAALLVIDDADLTGGALTEAVRELAKLPLLLLATALQARLAPNLDIAETLTLTPLDADGVRAVARSHAGPREDAAVPVDRLLCASGGVPARVHHEAAEWAREAAAWRLRAMAQSAAHERTGLRAAEDDLAGSVVELQTILERSAWDAMPEVVACPFKGLASFDVDDADVFFGRERLVADMVARIVGAPLVGIVGPSGSGKSSALRAGLLAALRADVLPGSRSWPIALLRPGEHPVEALEQAIGSVAQSGRLVVAVDQFEEAFVACRDEDERVAFADALVACARDPQRRALVLLAIRADFYGRCASYPELWRLLGANQVPVGPMRRDELRRAIELPARRAGLLVAPELVDALIVDVEGASGALPLLSSSLLELWQHRDGRRLHMSAYQQAGGVHGAVARLAERTYERLDPADREVARRILLRLAGEGEGDLIVRRRVELAQFTGEGDHAVTDVLSRLADGRLVTIDEGAVEVAHEALLREWPRLRGWLEEDAHGRRLHQQLSSTARQWEAGGHDAGDLYRGGRLASTVDWAAEHQPDLNAIERAFLAASRTASERWQRRLRAVLTGVAALLILAVVAGVVALEQRGNAQDAATAAEAQRLGAGALLDSQLDRALLLARQGVALDDTVRTRGNLLGALVRSPAAIGIIRADHATVLSAAIAPDGRTLAVGNLKGEVLFFDTRSRRRVATLEPGANEPAVQALAYSPDGSRLAVAYTSVAGLTAEYPEGWRFIVALVDGRTRRIVTRIQMQPEQPVAGVQFSPDGRTLGVTTHGVPLMRRFDARTGRRSAAPVPFRHSGWLTSDPYQNWPRSPVMMTSDRRVVVGGGDGVTVRDASTLAALETYRHAGRNAIGTQPTAYALSADDRTVAIGGRDGSLRLLDLPSGTMSTASGRHRAAVNEAAFTPDSRTLVTTGQDGDVILWDVRRAAAAETLPGHARSAFSPQIADGGRSLYTTSLDGTVLVWDLAGGDRLGRRFVAGTGHGSRYSLSSDGRLLARAQADGTVSLVHMRTLTSRGAFPVVREKGPEGRGGAESLAFVPGSHLLVVSGTYGSVWVVDADRGRVLARLKGHPRTIDFGAEALANPIWTPGLSADGRLLASASKDGIVRLWSLPDGRPQGAPLRFPHGNAQAQLSPDGRWLSVVPLNEARVQDRMEIWDVRRRERVRTIRSPAGVSIARFSPDGRFIAVADLRGRVQVLSTATWEGVTPWLTGGSAATWMAFAPRGDTLATGHADGTVRLWDVASGQAVGAPLPGASHSTVIPMFTPDGTHLVAAHDNGRAYRWDLRPESLIRQACRVAGRRLTTAEWEEFLPGRAYAPAC